jgi:hypothetical protein
MSNSETSLARGLRPKLFVSSLRVAVKVISMRSLYASHSQMALKTYDKDTKFTKNSFVNFVSLSLIIFYKVGA